MTQKEKTKFRSTAPWKNLRSKKRLEQKGLDFISQTKLPAGANLHHLDEAHYTDLNPIKFVFLGKTMHKMVHFLFIYYRKDHSIIERLVWVLDEMEKYYLEKEK